MHGFGLSAKRLSEPFFTVSPNGLVKNLDPHQLQNHMEKVRFGGVHFLISIRRLLPHEDISTIDFESVN